MNRHIAFIDSNLIGVYALDMAKDMGHAVTFIHSSDIHWYTHNKDYGRIISRVDRTIEMETTSDEDALCLILEKLNKEAPIDAVMTTWEFSIRTIARVCRRLGLSFTNAKAVEIARDKFLCRQVLALENVPSARCALAADIHAALEAAGDIGYPVIAKPVSGAASFFARLVHTDEEMQALFDLRAAKLARIPQSLKKDLSRGMLIEERLKGELISVEIGMSRGAPVIFMITGRKCSRENEALELGAVMPADLGATQEAAAEAYALTIVRALGLDKGIFHIEMMLTPDGPRLIEANPRLMGAMLPRLYENLSGRSIFQDLIKIHLDEPVAPPPREFPHAAISHCVAVAEDGAIPPDYDLSWLEEYRGDLLLFDLPISPGQKVRKLESSEEIFGFMQLKAPDARSGQKRAEEIIKRLGRSLGLTMAA